MSNSDYDYIFRYIALLESFGKAPQDSMRYVWYHEYFAGSREHAAPLAQWSLWL
jgi:hypothetical protein